MPSTTWPSIARGAYTIHDEAGAPQSPPRERGGAQKERAGERIEIPASAPSRGSFARDGVGFALDAAIAGYLPAALAQARAPLVLLALLHLTSLVTGALRSERRAFAVRALSVGAMAWLVVGGFQLGAIAATAHATARLDVPTKVALLCGAVLVLGTGLLGLSQRREDRGPSRGSRFPMGGLVVLATLAALRLYVLERTARGEDAPARAAESQLLVELRARSLVEALPPAPRGRVLPSAAPDPIACARPAGEVPTLFVSHLTPEHAPLPMGASCLQAETAASLDDVLRAELGRRGARGPLRLALVVRSAELPASPLASALALLPTRDAVCSEVACLLPEQLLARGAYSRRHLPLLDEDLLLGPSPSALLGWLEPRRRGNASARLTRLEVHRYDVDPDGSVTAHAGETPRDRSIEGAR